MKFCALADPELADLLVMASNPMTLANARAAAQRSPSRVFANALVNNAWGNGPAEETTPVRSTATRSWRAARRSRRSGRSWTTPASASLSACPCA
jgi:hypothetical protein